MLSRLGSGMKRREFLGLLGSALPAWPPVAHAQSERMRRMGILMNLSAGDPQAKRRVDVLKTTLAGLGWSEGKNLHIDYRSSADRDVIRQNAGELVALAPDVIVANAPPSVQALQRVSHFIPVVFTAG